MVDISDLPLQPFKNQICYRLINSKFPPNDLFDDVADPDEFDAIYAIQAKTNPRLLNNLGKINLVPMNKRPMGIDGFMYAMGPFVHVNPAGSRFTNGEFGVYYAAKEEKTAIAETRYHQELYFRNVQGLKFDRIVMRSLCTTFSADLINIKESLVTEDDWYNENTYTAAQQFGKEVKQQNKPGIWYGSVRNKYCDCYALFSPQWITQVVQGAHYEYVWDGTKIKDIYQLNKK